MSIPISRRRLVIASVVAVLTVCAGPLAANGEASRYWSTGSTGYSKTGVGNCRYLNAWNQINMFPAPPTVYAPNATTARDWRWVRIRAFAVNRYNGAVTGGTWSDWAVAYDNAPASFPTNTFVNGLSARYPHSYRLELRIEWWNSTTMLGAAAHRISPYRYSFGGGWSGYYDYCGYIGEFGS